MNNKDRNISGHFDYLNREERRKKGQRSGFKIQAKLPKKNKD